jgi:RNA polymerase sigma-70 factor, ECF subfamily
MGALVLTSKPASTEFEPGARQEMLLVRQIVAGRSDLFRNLIEAHLPVLRSMITAKMGNDPDTEDVLQQVVYKAWSHLDRFRFEARFRTWLIRITINEILHHARRRRASRAIPLDSRGLSQLAGDPQESPLRCCARNQSIRLIHTALSRLPEKYRIVVRMCDLEGRPAAEVARIMRLTASAVKSRRYRGHLQMARFLAFRLAAPLDRSSVRPAR